MSGVVVKEHSGSPFLSRIIRATEELEDAYSHLQSIWEHLDRIHRPNISLKDRVSGDIDIEEEQPEEEVKLTCEYLRKRAGSDEARTEEKDEEEVKECNLLISELLKDVQEQKIKREEAVKKMIGRHLSLHKDIPLPGTPSRAELTEQQLESDEYFHVPYHKRLLRTLPVSLCYSLEETIFSVDVKDGLADSLDKLARFDIMSAPVVKGNAVTGIIDVMDILRYIMYLAKKKSELDMEKHYETVKVGKVLKKLQKMNEISTFTLFDDRDSLYHLFQLFGTGVHRVPVVNKASGKCLAIVSQSHVVSLLHSEPRLLGPKARLPLSSHLCIRPKENLWAVHTSVRTYVAFDILIRYNVTAVPVVDEESKLVGAISANSVKGLKHGSFVALTYPVGEFLQSLTNNASRHTKSLAVCSESDSFLEAINRLHATKTHRIFVVDEEKRLSGMLSLTDLLHCIVTVTELESS